MENILRGNDYVPTDFYDTYRKEKEKVDFAAKKSCSRTVIVNIFEKFKLKQSRMMSYQRATKYLYKTTY